MLSDRSQDRQAILLLCAKLGQNGDTAQPLTARQYSALDKWLHERSLRPGSLLHHEGREQLADLQLKGVASSQVERLLDRGAVLGLMVERWTRSGIWILSREDDEYPARFNSYLQHAAPPVLYGVGEMSSLQQGGLAIVGSRYASEEDMAFAERLGTMCADQQLSAISGAAKGIDSVSMMAALDNGGRAIGVLADGLGRAAVAGSYHDAILDGRLTLISPYEPESRWFPYTAMERNKLIYALADAAVVVASSDEQGGTWTGAVEALKQGQIPIYVKASGEVSNGNRKLIEAGCYELASDALDNLGQLFANLPRSLHLFRKGNRGKESQTPEALEAQSELFPDIHLKSSRSKSEAAEADAYNQFVKLVLDLLTEPLDTQSIVEKLKVPRSRAGKWLKQLVKEGKIEKTTKRPLRYVRALSDPHHLPN